jgi:CTP:molybdopterin cytidylyltransferase MocA
VIAAAVIVAAGSGTRLGGVAKALLRTPGGETYLGAIVTRLRGAGVGEIVVVVGAPFGGEVGAHAETLGARVIENREPARGMASSIACGFATLSGGDAAWLWPVDHPSVRGETLAAIASAWRGGVVIPRYQGRGGHPPLVGAARWPALAACADAPDGARAVLRGEGVVDVAVDDPGVVRDVDTPEDLPR